MSLGSYGFNLVQTNSFVKQKTIHETSACEVYIATRKNGANADGSENSEKDGEVVVIRRTKIVGPNSLDSFDLQSELYSLCNHRNIVRPSALCMDPPTYAQILPLARFGSLYELLHDPAREQQRQALTWPLCFSLAHDIASAINYLHVDLGLMFRDLKPANVLVFDDYCAKLTDFDTVKYADESKNRTKTVYHHGPSGGFHKAFIAGTLVYMAPELMMNKPYTTAADIYSLGVTMNELATGCIPYSDVETTTLQFHTVIEANYSQQALMQDITTKKLRPNPASVAPTYAGSESIPTRYAQLAQACWAANNGERPSSSDVLERLNEIASAQKYSDVISKPDVRRAMAARSLQAATDSVASKNGTPANKSADGKEVDVVLHPREAAAKKSKAKVQPRNQFFVQSEDLRERSSKVNWKAFSNGVGKPDKYVPIVRGGGLASYGLRGADNMEDAFFINESLDQTFVASQGYGAAHIYGVADGHAGPGAAVFVQDHFVDTLLAILIAGQKENTVTMQEALTAAFVQIDHDFVEWAKANGDSSGCALIVCVVVDGTVYIANAGDCRAVIGRKDYDDVEDLSHDHNTSNPKERERVETEFGTKIITTADGKKRVAGRIEATRSIGDPSLKKYGLTCEPEIQVYEVQKNDRFIILATDGVWDVMSSAVASHYLLNTIFHEDYGAKRIVSEALSLGSTDNVTAVAIYLYDPQSKDHERSTKF